MVEGNSVLVSSMAGDPSCHLRWIPRAAQLATVNS